jgi:hypothetical protein
MTNDETKRPASIRPSAAGSTIEFFLDPDTRREIDERAAARGETRGDVIRRFIGIGLERDDLRPTG